MAAALSAAAWSVFAAELPITQTEPVIVTATRFSDPTERFPIGVAVIAEDEIRRSTASTVPELLRELPGIRVRDLSGSPNLQVDLRGFGIFGDQNTLVLLDGQRISENEQAPVNWSAIPLSAIERIEILRGSGAVLYGGGATGGTINIITKAPRRNERFGFVSGGAGSYNTREVGTGANLAGEHAGLRANASHFESDNYRDNNRLRLDNAQADLRWWGGAGSLTLKLGADDQRVGLPGSISEGQIAQNRRQAATPGDLSTLRSGYLNLGGETTLVFGELAVNMGYREKDTDASFFVGTPFRNNVETRVTVRSFTPRLKVPHRLGGWEHSLVVGIDADDWDLDSTAGPSVVGRPHAVQRNAAAYAQHTTLFPGDIALAVGLREHRVTYGVNDPANPGAAETRKRTLSAYELAVRRRLGESLSVYGKLGRSFRVPNVNDIYNLFTATVTMLEPQTSHERELGADIRSGRGRYRVALYHMDLDNEIFFDPIAFSNRNLPPTRRYGLEAEGKWRVGDGLELFANYTYAVSEFRAGSFGGIPIAGNEVPLVPRHALNAGAGWAFAPRTRVDAVLRYVGSQVFDGDESNTFGRKIPAYTVVDFKLLHEAGGWLFSAAVRNLFNEKYFSYGVFTGFPTFSALPAPERAVFVSAQYAFK